VAEWIAESPGTVDRLPQWNLSAANLAAEVRCRGSSLQRKFAVAEIRFRSLEIANR
jgi:hypothetical protein